jgi:RNA polymerase sigma-70 factor (ECF subfamily)
MIFHVTLIPPFTAFFVISFPAKMPDLNEWSLVERLKNGEASAFKEVVEGAQGLVYNTALGIVQNPEDAEDVAQEVFVQLYESIRSFKGESKLTTWLYRIAVSKAMDHLRRKKRKKRFAFVQSLFGANEELIHDPPDFVHPGVNLDNKEKAAELFKAIERLPEKQKIAFTLNRIEGLSYQEISEIMKLSIPSIESLLHRARKNLRKTLETFYLQNGE